MFKRILLPTDGSDLSKKAVKKGIEFAKSINATVVGFFSPEDYRALMYSEYVPPSLISQDEFEANAKKAAEKQLAFIEKAAAAANVAYEGFYMSSITPWEAIVDAAKKKKWVARKKSCHRPKGGGRKVVGRPKHKIIKNKKKTLRV